MNKNEMYLALIQKALEVSEVIGMKLDVFFLNGRSLSMYLDIKGNRVTLIDIWSISEKEFPELLNQIESFRSLDIGAYTKKIKLEISEDLAREKGLIA